MRGADTGGGRVLADALPGSEAAVGEQARMLELVQRVGHLGYWRLDLAAGRLEWSAGLCALFGIDAARAGETLADLRRPVLDEDRAALDARDAPGAAPAAHDALYRIRRPDGSVRWMRERETREVDARAGREVRVAVVSDVTGQQAARDELERSVWLQRIACRAARLGGWTIDLPERTLTWSEENCAIHEVPPGYRPSLQEGLALFAEEHRAEVVAKVEACARDGTPYEFELPKYTARGRRIWVHSYGEAVRDASGRIVRLQGAFQDITAQKRAADALRESEERFLILSRAAHDAIRDCNLADGKLWWSDGLEALFGHAPDAAPTRAAWRELVHPDDRARVEAAIAAAVDGARAHWRVDYRFARAGGGFARVEERGHVIRDAGGRAVRALAAVSDVTERHALEEELRQAHRLESVGRLTGGVAHDFNNLLTVILGSGTLLHELAAGNAQLASLAEMVTHAAQRGAELTQRLLAFARKQILDPKPVDVRQMLSGMQPLLERTLGEHIRVAVALAPDLRAAHIDPGQLENAVLNLCLNARDAMPAGGELVVEAANARIGPDAPAPGGGPAPGDYVRLAISDTGAGIAPELLARVFEPFFTTKETGQGTGLGLAMVYGFVKQSGGHVTLDSEPNRGTRVTLYLPVSAEPAPAAAQPPAPAPAAGGSETLLVVEDNELVRLAARRHLLQLGYRVLEAESAEHALAILRGGEPVDLLFTDVVMPGMRGPELVQAARALRPGLRALLTSGYVGDAAVAPLASGTPLLAKPYHPPELARMVREALDAG